MCPNLANSRHSGRKPCARHRWDGGRVQQQEHLRGSDAMMPMLTDSSLLPCGVQSTRVAAQCLSVSKPLNCPDWIVYYFCDWGLVQNKGHGRGMVGGRHTMAGSSAQLAWPILSALQAERASC